MEKKPSEFEDLSSVQAVLVGALAPGVNVSTFIHYAYFTIICWFICLIICWVKIVWLVLKNTKFAGSNMDYLENGVCNAGYKSNFDACSGFYI